MSELESDLRVSSAEQQKNKRTLLAIVIVSVLPVFAAYTAFFTGIGVPEHTVNEGILLARPASVEPLVSAETWARMQQEKKWRLLLPLSLPCAEACQQQWYTTRQVHIRLGEKSERVERLALNLSGAEGERYLDEIAAEHPLLQRDRAAPHHWQPWLEQQQELLALEGAPFYLLVDQEGRAMMLYTDQHGNALLKDLKRALKYSIDYQ